jgi:hypothetical protein
MDLSSFSFLFPDRKKSTPKKIQRWIFIILAALGLLAMIAFKMSNNFTYQESPEQTPPPSQGLSLDDFSDL